MSACLHGLYPGQVGILVGGPGVGKTWFLLSILSDIVYSKNNSGFVNHTDKDTENIKIKMISLREPRTMLCDRLNKLNGKNTFINNYYDNILDIGCFNDSDTDTIITSITDIISKNDIVLVDDIESIHDMSIENILLLLNRFRFFSIKHKCSLLLTSTSLLYGELLDNTEMVSWVDSVQQVANMVLAMNIDIGKNVLAGPSRRVVTFMKNLHTKNLDEFYYRIDPGGLPRLIKSTVNMSEVKQTHPKILNMKKKYDI